jgi:hypothetical protein
LDGDSSGNELFAGDSPHRENVTVFVTVPQRMTDIQAFATRLRVRRDPRA